MARGGKRAGAGRKPTDKVAMTVRVSAEIRRAIEQYARRGRQSLSAEAEAIFADAIRERDKGDPRARALAYLVLRLCVTIYPTAAEVDGAKFKFDWLHNRTDFEALRSAIVRLLGRLSPDGEVDPDRYTFKHEGELLGETPEMVGEQAVRYLFSQIKLSDDPTLSEFLRGPWADPIRYGIPHAAKALGLK